MKDLRSKLENILAKASGSYAYERIADQILALIKQEWDEVLKEVEELGGYEPTKRAIFIKQKNWDKLKKLLNH